MWHLQQQHARVEKADKLLQLKVRKGICRYLLLVLIFKIANGVVETNFNI